MVNATGKIITIQPGGETSQLTVNQGNVYSCNNWEYYIDPNSYSYAYYGVKLKRDSDSYCEAWYKKENTQTCVLVPASIDETKPHYEKKWFLVQKS